MRKLVINCLWFLLVLVGTGWWSLKNATPTQAACWCTDPTLCRYARPGITSFYAYDYEYIPDKSKIKAILRVYCDTQTEKNSVFALKAPICGSSPEISPYCAPRVDKSLPDGADFGDLTCYGTEFSQGRSNVPEETENVIAWNKNVTFNDKDYGVVRQIKTCKSIAFCCARRDISCVKPSAIDPTFKEPTAPDAAWLQVNANPPASICGGALGRGESRIFIPHLRSISALATILQTMFNPFPSLLVNNALPAKQDRSSSFTDEAAITSKIDYHQGFDDSTPIVNEANNNSSLRVDVPAPEPLYSFDGNEPYNQNGMCVINDTKFNAGDDLLGPKIEASLTYTQKFTYEAKPKPAGCVADNQTVGPGQICCSGKSSFVSGLNRSICDTTPGVRIPTKGQVAIFTKTPLIEYIYDVLVMGPQSVFKRLMPQGNPAEIKEIPGEASFVATAPGADQLAVGGASGGTPKLYFPHVGSLYEYFLQGLQKALRPGVAGLAITASTGNDSLDTIAARYKVPASFLKAIWTIETGQDSGSGCKCEPGRACGPMQIGDGAYANVTDSSENLDRCKLPDAFEIAARVLLDKKYCTLGTPDTCRQLHDSPTLYLTIGSVEPNEYEVPGKYHGTNNCAPSNETQCRWGLGYSYCDAIRALENDLPLPTSGDPASCPGSNIR